MLILLFLGILLAWYLQREVYRKYWDRNLEATVRFTEPYTYEGDTSCFQEEIVNDKLLPLTALEVRIVTSRNLEFGGEAKENTSVSDQSYLRDVFSFFGHQKVIRRIPFVCRKRGCYEVRKAELVGYDLLFANKYYLEQKQQTQMYVYPKQVDVSRIRLICQAISGMVLSQRRLYPDPFEFAGIREYQVTDPMNRINWKASARSGDLMVNQYDSTTNIQVTVILDVEDSGIMKYEELVEESIRITSSLSAVLTGKNVELDICSNAFVSETGHTGTKECAEGAILNMHLKSGTGQMQQLNQKLACIDASHKAEPIHTVLMQEELVKRTGHIFVLLSKNRTEETAAAVRNLVQRGNQVLWVIPLHPYMELEAVSACGAEEISWEVG